MHFYSRNSDDFLLTVRFLQIHMIQVWSLYPENSFVLFYIFCSQNNFLFYGLTKDDRGLSAIRLAFLSLTLNFGNLDTNKIPSLNHLCSEIRYNFLKPIIGWIQPHFETNLTFKHLSISSNGLLCHCFLGHFSHWFWRSEKFCINSPSAKSKRKYSTCITFSKKGFLWTSRLW